jgi:hypothetical protein
MLEPGLGRYVLRVFVLGMFVPRCRSRSLRLDRLARLPATQGNIDAHTL